MRWRPRALPSWKACPALRVFRMAGLWFEMAGSWFRPDYGGWVKFPVFDERGFPIVDDALATAVPGLYFCGVHFLRKRRSSLLFGVGEDAAIIARTITKALTASPTSA